MCDVIAGFLRTSRFKLRSEVSGSQQSALLLNYNIDNSDNGQWNAVKPGNLADSVFKSARANWVCFDFYLTVSAKKNQLHYSPSVLNKRS